MPIADPVFSWQEALAAFTIVTVAAFLVTWVLTDLLRVRRAPYIPMLLAMALGLGAGYLVWSGTSASDLLSAGAGWGLAAGLIAAAIALPLVQRLPAHPPSCPNSPAPHTSIANSCHRGKASTPTPTGNFTITRRIDGWRQSPLGLMWRPNYFYRGYAVHGSTSVPAYPASHGCVRVRCPR